MTEERKLKISPPILVGIVIAVGWVGMLIWPSIVNRDAPDAPEQPASSLAGELVEDVAPSTPALPPFESLEDSGESGWSTYHGDAALTGAVQTTLPAEPSVLWHYQADTAVYHTPVACNGRIYFSSYKGGVFAIDYEGNELWSKHLVREIREDGTSRMERFDAPISCFGSTVLIGSMSGKLFAFDGETGDEVWTYDVGGPVLGTVNLLRSATEDVSDRAFVISQDDGSLHAIDLETGKRVWKTESIDRCDGSPSVKNGKIVFGSCAAALHVFSATDGQLLRNIEFDPDSQVAGGIALVDESAYSGSHSGHVFRVNVQTGEILWMNEDSEDEVLSTPSVAGDYVVFTSYDGGVYALDRQTGEKKWKYDTEGWPTSPIIAGDKVVVSADGLLYLLDLTTGDELWSYEVSDEISSPAIIDGMLVVGSEDGTVTAFGVARN